MLRRIREGERVLQTSEITLTSEDKIDAIHRLMEACKSDLNNKQIYQWTDAYPNRQFVE
jgi:hypothetical protein